MAKIYGVNTVDGCNIDGCQITSLWARRYGILPVQLYRTNRIIWLQCTALPTGDLPQQVRYL